MLQEIRDKTHGWIAGIIISFLIMSFALWGIHSYFGGGGNTDVIAKVNGVEITKEQFAEAYNHLNRQQYNANPELEANLKKQALTSLINVQVMRQASLDQHYLVSSEQIGSYLENIPDFQINGQFSNTRFQQVLANNRLSVPGFLDLVQTSLLIDQPRLGLIFTSFSLPSEATNTYSLVEQKRDFDYTVLAFDSFAKQPISISKESIQSYYQTHQEEFKTPEQVSIEYIALSINDVIAKISANDEVLKRFYKENSASYNSPMQWKLEAVAMPKGMGEKFLNHWITLTQVPEEWQEAVLKLKKPGQVSEMIKTHQGNVILKLAAFQDAAQQSYEAVKTKVKETYVRQQAEEQFANLKEKLANATYEHPESLEPAAKALGFSIKKTELFSREKGGSDNISSNPKIREVAFSSEVLDKQNNSDVVPVSQDTLAVIRISKHLPAAVLPLNEVQNKIEAVLRKQEIEKKAYAAAELIKTELQKGESITKLSEQNHLIWNSIGLTGRHANKVDSSILNEVFQMPKPETGTGTSSFDIAKTPQGYAIIGLKSVQDGKLMDNAPNQQYKVYSEQIQNTQGLLEYELFKQSQLQQAKIVIES